MHCEHEKQSLVLIHMLQLTMTDKHFLLNKTCVSRSHILCLNMMVQMIDTDLKLAVKNIPFYVISLFHSFFLSQQRFQAPH